MSNRRCDRLVRQPSITDSSSGESIDSEGSDDVESGRGDHSIHTSDEEFIEPDTGTDSEGEYQYNSDDERSQSSGANDENESTGGDDEDEDDLSSPELEALRTLSIDDSPRKDCELPLVRSSVETGQCIVTRRVCGCRSTYGALPGRRVSEGEDEGEEEVSGRDSMAKP
jgi:hypothetical protein